jgi:hypothetical protein
MSLPLKGQIYQILIKEEGSAILNLFFTVNRLADKLLHVIVQCE